MRLSRLTTSASRRSSQAATTPAPPARRAEREAVRRRHAARDAAVLHPQEGAEPRGLSLSRDLRLPRGDEREASRGAAAPRVLHELAVGEPLVCAEEAADAV